MKYLVEGKSWSILIEDKNILDITFYPKSDVQDDMFDKLGATLIITLINGKQFKMRGQAAEECWEAIARDAYLIKVRDGRISQVPDEQ